MRKLASFDRNSASTVRQEIDQYSAKLFVLVTILGAFGLFLPIFVSDRGAVNYERNLDDERRDEIHSSVNGVSFTHAVLTATVVAVTLASDGALDALYGSRFVSIIGKPRWLLLLALGLPNIVIYICHLKGDLTIGTPGITARSVYFFIVSISDFYNPCLPTQACSLVAPICASSASRQHCSISTTE